jgi:hypothetical protein
MNTVEQYLIDFQPAINHLLNFYEAHGIKRLTLDASFQTTMTLYSYSSGYSYTEIKLISILTYIKFNNLPLDSTEFNNLCAQLKLTINNEVI